MGRSFFNIVDYGAVNDGESLNTKAFEKAIEDCFKAGGGTVYVPTGVFLTGSIKLKSNIRLYLEAGARIKFSPDINHYKTIINRWEGKEQEVYTPLIYGKGLENVTIAGHGILDGQGKYWWDLFQKQQLKYHRPRFISLTECDHVLIEDITLIDSPSWTINPLKCHNVTVNKVTIKNPPQSPNTDGINPSSCKNVHISNCHVDVGDDCITLKSGTEECSSLIPCENITITNCTMVHGHGGVVIGSEMSGCVRNVVITNCVFEGTDRGIRLKSRRGRGGVVEDVRVNNIVMKEVLCPLIMNLYYFCGEGGKDKKVWDKNSYPVTNKTPSFKNIHFTDITANDVKTTAAFIYGLPEMPVRDITFNNISITLTEDSKPEVPAMMSHLKPVKQQGFYCNNFSNFKFNNVKVSGHRGPGFEMVEGKEVEFISCEIAASDKEKNQKSNQYYIVMNNVDQAFFFGNKQQDLNEFLELKGTNEYMVR